jgi:hypothetical protein
MTFQLIDQERAHHAVSRLCSVVNVTRQDFWTWTKGRSASESRLARRLSGRLARGGVAATVVHRPQHRRER